jgi:hypothetical protein
MHARTRARTHPLPLLPMTSAAASSSSALAHTCRYAHAAQRDAMRCVSASSEGERSWKETEKALRRTACETVSQVFSTTRCAT